MFYFIAFFLKKEVARGGEQTWVLSILFFSFFTTLPLSHSGSPCFISLLFGLACRALEQLRDEEKERLRLEFHEGRLREMEREVEQVRRHLKHRCPWSECE
jgi:hypothetical protein